MIVLSKVIETFRWDIYSQSCYMTQLYLCCASEFLIIMLYTAWFTCKSWWLYLKNRRSHWQCLIGVSAHVSKHEVIRKFAAPLCASHTGSKSFESQKMSWQRAQYCNSGQCLLLLCSRRNHFGPAWAGLLGTYQVISIWTDSKAPYFCLMTLWKNSSKNAFTTKFLANNTTVILLNRDKSIANK